ncbi:MAG: hypothetical protein C0405_09775, partial [Desulfovibrio sp.]|nr:hypothetical protein [Desulfovibrio sp.]
QAYKELGESQRAEADIQRLRELKAASGSPAAPASAPIAPVTANPEPPPAKAAAPTSPSGKEPASAEEFFQRANSWGRQGQYDKALADFDQAIRLKPDYTHAHFNRAMALADMGQLPQAVAGYTKVLELDPGFLPVFNDRGRLLLKMGRVKEALADFDRAVNQDQDKRLKVFGLHNRGNARVKTGQFASAVDDYTQAMALGYKPVDIYMARGEAHRLGRQYDKALADFQQAKQLKPDLLDPIIFSAMTLAALERYPEALAQADQALKMRPGEPKVLAVRGNLLFLNGRFAEAAQVMEPLLATTDPNHRPTLLLWLYVARERGGQPSRQWLAQQAQGLDLSQWPGVIIDLFLGKATPQDVNGQAVKSTRVVEEARHQQNQGYFFLSQYYLLRGIPIDARINLEHCIRRDMQDTGEFLAARAEMKRMGPEPEKKARKGKSKE